MNQVEKFSLYHVFEMSHVLKQFLVIHKKNIHFCTLIKLVHQTQHHCNGHTRHKS